MFYSQLILSKKGEPLSNIWLAAHYTRKLKKKDIFVTDITESANSIQYPDQPIALRVSGHLLLGVVRIYQKKVVYLLQDCNEANTKIKLVRPLRRARAAALEPPSHPPALSSTQVRRSPPPRDCAPRHRNSPRAPARWTSPSRRDAT
jgi:hypothetical protein